MHELLATLLPRLFRGLVASLVMCLMVLGVQAQGPAMQQVVGTPTHSTLVPAQPFVWSTVVGLGTVQVPIPGQFGWFVPLGLDLEVRPVPSLSGDPTLEAIFFPPLSGHPTKAERITFQFPLDPASIPGSGALVIAFHSFGVSEKDIWINTNLAQLCQQRGWLLVAPYGLVDTHFGNVQSQISLNKVLETVGKFFHWDKNRVYTVGFSMGGGAALSYSMRRLSSPRLQVAGVINHTGTQDLIAEYNLGGFVMKQLLSDANHFNGTPLTEDGSFAYKRVSPAILNSGVVDPDATPLRNLAHLPIYSFHNVGDPKVKLLQDNIAVNAYLLSQGFNVNTVTASKGPFHAWNTMDMAAALNWISSYSLPQAPLAASIFADLEAPYFGTKVRSKPDNRVAYFEFAGDRGTNSFTVSDTRDLDVLELDLTALGINPSLAIGGLWDSQDNSGDDLVLTGIPAVPSQVLMNGTAISTWSFDAVLGELTIPIPAGMPQAILLVKP